MAETKTVTAQAVEAQIKAILGAWGMGEPALSITARVLLWADLRGIDSHGISMISSSYRRMRDAGILNLQPKLERVVDLPAIATIDGDGGLGHYPSYTAMGLAIEKCRQTGIAAVAVRNSNHYGAAGYYAWMAAEAGLIGISSTGVRNPATVPTFGAEPRFGTNPLAFAAPAGRNRPFLLDMATSTVAIGKLVLAARAEKPLPVGWALDKDGKPLTDAKQARDIRYLTPVGGSRELGGHKGYGLAMMVEILCSTLSGASYSPTKPPHQPGEPYDVGHFFLAMDPGAFRDKAAFQADLDDMIDCLHATKRADPTQPVLVAGDPEADQMAQRSAHGIPLNSVLVDELREIARAANAEFTL
ncbi:MAG: Ldh family oxidoreductase [Alphaproteobacteria bacterium]|nr:Ldh family oxidoreductase [Alphaproteobacteria bacterium]